MSERIRISNANGTWVVRGGGAILGETDRALQMDEPGRDPVVYFPCDDVAMAFLDQSETRAECPFRGRATHYSLQTQNSLVPDVGWSYDSPREGFEAIAGYVAFYTDKVAVEGN